MAKLLLNLRHVPDDEAEEVRALLAEHDIAYYETPPNRWGVSMGGIWLSDDRQLEQARALMAEYQRERALASREAFAARQREGTAATLAGRLRREPLRLLAAAAIVGLIVYLVVSPFFRLAG